jgi:hypothetical protein
MNHCANIWPGPIDLGMDEAFGIQRSTLRVDGISVEIEFDEIGRCHQLRRQRSSHDESIGSTIMPRADMPEPIEYALLGKNSICRDKVGYERRISRPRRRRRLLSFEKSVSGQQNGTRQEASPSYCFCHESEDITGA